MKQSLILSILLVLLSSSSLIASIHGRNNPANSPSPSSSQVATPAAGPSNSDCSTVIYSMMDCLSYLSVGSNDTKPEKSCCDAIETVLEYNPQCICVGLKSSQDLGIALNTTRALATPMTCKLPIGPPQCAVSTPSASSPGLSPVSPSAGKPQTSPSSAGPPKTSPSLAESPAMTAPSPSISGTTTLSVPILILFSIIVSSIA